MIDWRASAQAIERQVRAFHPWPGAETRAGGEPLRVLGARIEEATFPEADMVSRTAGAAAAEQPGTIVAVRRDAVVVRCGEGQLALTELQRPGRKALAAGEFVNAVRLMPGQRLG